jgi:hyperosmotically inducible periplasmic protein
MWKRIARGTIMVSSVMFIAPTLSARADEPQAPQGAPVKDDWITSQVKQRLSTDVAGSNKVDVDTKDDVVKLSGSAPSETTRIQAVQAARAVPGVRQVKDEIKVNQAP